MKEQTESKNASSKICLICHKAVPSDVDTCPDDGGELINMKQQDKLIGEVFASRYRIISVVGQGGMSTVYKAQHTYMDRVVALKLLHPHLVSDPLSVQRFQQEAKAAASLSHPNIITVYDFGVTEAGLAFLVMDYLEGPSLGDLLDRTGPVPQDEALDIFRQILKGLSHAHRKGVIHRDLKPRNLVLAVDEDGSVQVKIVDFGIAKMIPQEGGESQHLTQTGEVFGSPIYMSPEQCSGQTLDLRSDIYSLGCVMFEVLTGMPPFLGKNAVETMSLHVNEEPPDINKVSESVQVSKEMVEVINGCLAKLPKNRYRSAADILEALPMPGGTQRINQSGTVAMKLEDMLRSTSLPAGSPGRGQAPRKTRRNNLRIKSSTLATIFGVSFFSLLALVSYFPFETEGHRGSPLRKMWWQFELWLGDKFVESGWPGVAVTVFEDAVRTAKSLQGGSSKPSNYEAVIESLTNLSLALAAAGRSADQDAVVCQILNLDRERWEKRARELLKEVDASWKYFKELKTKVAPEQLELRKAEPQLNWKGSVRTIVETARRLDVTYAYGLEFELLKQSQNFLEDLYGPNFVGLADIMNQQAECLENQDQIETIINDKIYERIREIRFNYNKVELRRDPWQDPEYIRSVLHLGQWQRDRSEFKEAGVNLKDAVAHAEKSKAIGPDQLAEYYSSYADYLEQTKDLHQATIYRDLASCQREKAKQLCTAGKHDETDR